MNLKQLAEQLGLSQTTVSRALNGYPEVNETTRLRVSEAARRLGYSANANARRLATGRAGAFGIVYIQAEGFGPHISEFLGGLGSRLVRREIDIVVTTVESYEDELAAYRRAAASKRIDAVILHSPRPKDDRISLLQDLGLPFVLHGRADKAPYHAWLDIDNTDAIRKATEHLLELGHRRIALISGPTGLTFVEHRLSGYREALAAAGVAFDPALVCNGPFVDEVAFRAAHELLQRQPRPTAFLAGSMMTALGTFRAIRAAGLVLGRDVSMVAHDDVFPYLNADNMVPPMSATRSSIRAAGARIAELTLEVLAGRPVADIQELWPVELLVRESSGPAH